MIPFSILDLAPVTEGSDAAQAFRNTLDLAQLGERPWLPALLAGRASQHARHRQCGHGGADRPCGRRHLDDPRRRRRHHAAQPCAAAGGRAVRHAGLAVSGTRIDLGLGRAPGTDQPTARALRRYFDSADAFPQDVLELLGYFEPASPGQAVRAVPGAGIDVPVWLLGSSLFSAHLVGAAGPAVCLRLAFRAGRHGRGAGPLSRRDFRPSARCTSPMRCSALNVVAADTDAEARRLFTTQQQSFINLRRGRPGLIPPPIDDIESYWTPPEKLMVERALACAVVGDAGHRAAGHRGIRRAPSARRSAADCQHLRSRGAEAFVRTGRGRTQRTFVSLPRPSVIIRRLGPRLKKTIRA